MSFCEIILVGNVGRDPELRYTPGGRAVCNFSLATNRVWTDRETNERREETTWFKITVWGQQAETVNQYVQKGKQVMVIGNRIEAQAYLSQKTNEPMASLDVTAQRVVFLTNRGADSEGGRPSNDRDFYDDEGPANVDDIPF